ncbi:ImmA/IrrE family metallo-endopeptidase [Lactobacillus sp. ESL0228]|uniref:ImmA/IrrE family metallo-endopeptidase n=1 Tax=Lactobacillus sp. ESL0228 TaxID=2069352 RepID=UPI00210198E3|nr:ImmA/IrrE family metallo-endopeptidase [Lactobacillus sp. ESL0228]
MEVKFNPNQLKKARLMRGLSMAELANKSSLSRESISKYEQGVTKPRGDSILKLANALQFPTIFFGKSDTTIPMGTIFFRSQAASTNKLRKMQKIRLDFAAQSIRYISDYIKLPQLTIPDTVNLEIEEISNKIIQRKAFEVREIWHLGNGPIKNLTNTMEANGIIITETTMHNEKMDAVSTWANGRPIIALTDNNESVMRRRFNLAHELGHILLHASIENVFDLNNNEYKNLLEKQANQFASNLLMPDNAFIDYLTSTSMSFFRQAKLYWNVSIGALVYRANSLHLLSENQYLYLQKQISANHWRKHEIDDEKLAQEHPIIFKKALNMLLNVNLVSKQDLKMTLGFPVEDLETIFGMSFADDVHSYNEPHLKIIK